MAAADILSSTSDISFDGSMLADEYIRENDDTGINLASCENELLDEMDSYLEDINNRLIVSRMVGESTFKGMVNAIQEEAADKIALKEAEIAVLNKKLKHYESFVGSNGSYGLESEPGERKLGFLPSYPDLRQELDFVKQLDRFRFTAEEQLQRLRVWNDSSGEQEFEGGMQREVGIIMVQSLIMSLQDEFETKICEQRSLMNTITKNQRKWVDEISSVLHDLNMIHRSLSDSNPGNIKELNNGKKKDYVPSKIAVSKESGNGNFSMEKSEGLESGKNVAIDSPQLKCMTKEELITYFKKEMYAMKRQQELALHEKTEELFRFKRDSLKDKGSSPFHFYKEKDFDTLKKNISELILKLDDMLLEDKNLPHCYDDQEVSHMVKEKIDTFLKNQWVHKLLADERKEANRVIPQDSNEANFVEEIERLQLAIEEVKIESTIKEEKYKSALEDLVGEIESDKEALETITKIIEDNYFIIYKGVAADALSNIYPIVMECYKEKDLINTALSEKKKELSLEAEENENLKQELDSLSTLMKDKEELALEASCRLVKQKEQFDLVSIELDMYRNQVSKLEWIITNTENELDSLKGKLDTAFQQLQKKEVEISNLTQNANITSAALKEAERQNVILHRDIQEKQEELVSAITKDREQSRQLESILISLTVLSKAICDWKWRFEQKIGTNESRLNLLSQQCSQIKEHGNLLKIKASWYKERYYARCEDLRKAETEVDLLGDEVDTLLGLLQRIYLALDHYSPVLQHYPGVVETLKLIRREMDRETTN